MNYKQRIILLAGPTGSGKSKLAIKLAKYFDGEIINADSMQIYREIRILSSRPTDKDQKKIKHHLYGFKNSKIESFSMNVIWDELIKKNLLVGSESKQKFLHLNNSETYKKIVNEKIIH